MPRQGRTGWTLVIVGVGYIAVFPQGAAVRDRAADHHARSGSTVVGMLVLIMLGTINIRMAEMRDAPSGHACRSSIPTLRSRK